MGPFCLVAPLSILLGSVIGSVAPLAHLVLSCFATGTFLYVGASEVIMEGERKMYLTPVFGCAIPAWDAQNVLQADT